MQFDQISTSDELLNLIRWHNEHSEYVVLDIETTGLNTFKDSIVAIILSGRNVNSSVYIPGNLLQHLSRLRVKTLVLHNFKFDYSMCYRNGLDLRQCGGMADTMLLHHLVDENASHALDDIIQERYHDNYKKTFWNKYKNFENASEGDKLEYACKDVIYTNTLYRDLQLDIKNNEIPQSLVKHVHDLALAFYDTELSGLRVDLQYLTELGVELKPKILEFRNKMRSNVDAACNSIELDKWSEDIDKAWTPTGKKWKTLLKPEFNFDSSKQLATLLYHKLKLPVQKNKTGGFTADDKALEVLKDLHPVITMIQEYRGYQKVYGSFIEGTLERMNNGRIYPSFNINGTVTGRISSSNPNMQQLPAQGEWAKVRGIYIPDEGYKIITCDYSQLEVVIAAHFSQDKNLLKIVLEGISKHDITANNLGIPREQAKTLNFAMQYQCTHHKVKDILGCSESDAKYTWDKYWETYNGEKRVIDKCSKRVDSGQPIINPFGRRRHFPFKFEFKWQQSSAYRQAYSSLIQGTGADITHWSFIKMHQWLDGSGRGFIPQRGNTLFEVHDEIVIQAKENYCQKASDMLKYIMVDAGKHINLTVPLKVECSEPLERWAK